MEDIYVTKRKGVREKFNAEKINEVVENSCYGLKGVSASQIIMNAHLQFYDGVKSEDIQKMLIKSAADLITEYAPDYSKAAARLLVFHIRKQVFGQYDYPDFYEHIEENVLLFKYDKEILEKYSKEEIDELGNYIDSERDCELHYAAMVQLDSKYLVQDRKSGQKFEAPQQLFMLVGMCLFQEESEDIRLQYVKDFYDAVSLNKISLPTPIMGGVRTPTRQFSSCTLIDADDNLSSINATSSAIVNYASKRAGIGLNGGKIRSLGSPIRGGEAVHTGVIGFYKYFQSALKSCSQGAMRGASATLFYPWWHPEIQSMLVLKNNKGTEENRVRHMDYAFQANKFFYEKAQNQEEVCLFNPSDVGDMYEAFFGDQKLFSQLYEKYSQDPDKVCSKVNAYELMERFADERAATGRIYLHNVDHTNDYSPFNVKYEGNVIRMSNLCLEICLPTTPLKNIEDLEGEIALCTLAAFNLGNPTLFEDLPLLSKLVVRALDNLLDYQDYPVKAAEKNKLRRTLGVGVINTAYYLAKNGLKYSDGSGNNLIHETFEKIRYNLLKASCDLARDKEPCKWFHKTKYAKGILPIDNYKKEIDLYHTQELTCDWESLREDISKYGLRNSTTMALMPSETSSQVSNATNGIEPPRGLTTTKSSKDGAYKQVVPDVLDYWLDYETVWDIPDNKGYLTLCGIMQKWVDQAISANTNYDPYKFEKNKVPLQLILEDLYYAYHLGLKTLYYHNTRDGSGEDLEDDGCESGACKL